MLTVPSSRRDHQVDRGSTARVAIEWPGSSSVVASQIGSSQAVGNELPIDRGPKSSDTFVGLKITASPSLRLLRHAQLPIPEGHVSLSCQTPLVGGRTRTGRFLVATPEGALDRVAASQRANSLRTRPIRSELPTASRLTPTMAA